MDTEKFQNKVLSSLKELGEAFAVLRDGQKELYRIATLPVASGDNPSPVAGVTYINGLRDPRADGSAVPQLGDHYRAIDPKFTAFGRVIVREFPAAFPEVVLPTANGVNIVDFNTSRAGFANGISRNLDDSIIPDAVPWFGSRFDRTAPDGSLIEGWESGITKAWNLWLDSHPDLLGPGGFGQVDP